MSRKGYDLKNTQQMSRVILYGKSGGGVTMSFYQAVAENGLPCAREPKNSSNVGITLRGSLLRTG